MTTLPQTTGARFPRVGSRAPTIPTSAGSQAGAAGVQAGAGNALTLGDVLRVLRTNLPLIVILVTLGLVIGYLVNQYVLMKYFKKYTATAILQVQSPAMFDPMGAGGTSGYGDRVSLEVRQKTVAQKMQNPSLWTPLFDNDRSDFANNEWIKSFRTPEGAPDRAAASAAIQENLKVAPDASSELVSASLSAPTGPDAKVVLEAIVTQLIASEQINVTAATADERRTLATIQGQLTSQIANLTTQINDLAARLNSPRDKSGAAGGLLMARQLEMNMLLGDRREKQKVLQEAITNLTSFSAELDANGTPADLVQAISLDPSASRLEQQLDSIEFERKRLTAMNVGNESKSWQNNEAVYVATKEQLEARRETLRVRTGDAMRAARTAAVNNAKAEVESLDARVRELEANIAEASADQSRLSNLERQREIAEGKRSRIEDRLQTIEANQGRETNTRGTVTKVYDIKTPGEISFPKLFQTLGAAGMAGLMLALGIAFLREMMDTTVRSPRDVAKVGNLNLLGMIPHSDDDPQAADGELALAISNVPHSIISENFRQVRTRLQHAASLDTTRSLLVTSPGPGDGKTIVACNLAAGLALNGRKILLVDANFRRPALHGIFGINNEHGLGDVLTGATTIDAVAQPTTVPNLFVMTTGPRPGNPTELLESQLLTDLIDRALEDYDHVIFDAGPILLVSETVALAPRVDGVVTVVRAKANSRGLLMRMRDTLRQLKAEHLGVVLNGVRHHTGGYYARNTKNYYAYSKQIGV